VPEPVAPPYILYLIIEVDVWLGDRWWGTDCLTYTRDLQINGRTRGTTRMHKRWWIPAAGFTPAAWNALGKGVFSTNLVASRSSLGGPCNPRSGRRARCDGERLQQFLPHRCMMNSTSNLIRFVRLVSPSHAHPVRLRSGPLKPTHQLRPFLLLSWCGKAPGLTPGPDLKHILDCLHI
jgi:hypothetical protein